MLIFDIPRLPKAHREHLQTVYNTHMLHSSTADPFKLALYKLMGKLEPSRRNVPQVTTTTEDWIWLQLAMVRCSTVTLFNILNESL
jgi:nuclear pore complex protein Nup93